MVFITIISWWVAWYVISWRHAFDLFFLNYISKRYVNNNMSLQASVDSKTLLTERRSRYHLEAKWAPSTPPMILSANVTRGLDRKISFSAIGKNVFRETLTLQGTWRRLHLKYISVMCPRYLKMNNWMLNLFILKCNWTPCFSTNSNNMRCKELCCGLRLIHLWHFCIMLCYK